MTRIDLQALRLSPFSLVRAFHRILSGADQVLDADNLEIRKYFDANWYLETYTDVTAAGVDPLQHFLEYGEAEGRNPNGVFPTTYYRNKYMGAEPRDASPLRHFLRVGRALGLRISVKVSAEDFDL